MGVIVLITRRCIQLKRANRRKKNRKYKVRRIGVSIFLVIIFILLGYSTVKGVSYLKSKKEDKNSVSLEKNEIEEPAAQEPLKKNEKKDILLTAAGDCTLGTDTNFSTATSLPTMFQNQGNDYSYFFKNVNHLFKNDDYTIVNLETTFTDTKEKANKGDGTVFHFKGPKDFVNILTTSNIDGVTVANNHIYDYGDKGFNDTINVLKESNVDFCGEGYKFTKDLKGIKFGFLAYQAWEDTEKLRSSIKQDIDDLKAEGAKIIIPYFHWGIEKQTTPSEYQVNLARYTIDNGADLILGSHPHVMQSLENYKGKLITYSLANFSFGGNSNPSDKRTFILQLNFKFTDDNLDGYTFKVIPASISSIDYKNDYAPTPVEGSKKDSILKTLNDLSPSLKGTIKDEFVELTD